jgi:hypothetical protein
MTIGREPVASTTFLAVMIRLSPCDATATWCPSEPPRSMTADPKTSSLPAALRSCFTPEVSLFTMPPFQACIFFMSTVGAALTMMPMSPADFVIFW